MLWGIDGWLFRQVAAFKWPDYGVLEAIIIILLYRLGTVLGGTFASCL